MKYILIVLTLMLNFSSANAAGPMGSAIAPPTYAGYIKHVVGDLGWNSRPAYKAKYRIAPPFLAHALCDNEFAGSRAAEYDDFKYIFPKLTAGKYFIPDPVLGRNATKFLTKTGQEFTYSGPVTNQMCAGHTSYSISLKTFVIDTNTKKIEESGCNNSLFIACVRD